MKFGRRRLSGGVKNSVKRFGPHAKTLLCIRKRAPPITVDRPHREKRWRQQHLAVGTIRKLVRRDVKNGQDKDRKAAADAGTEVNVTAEQLTEVFIKACRCLRMALSKS